MSKDKKEIDTDDVINPVVQARAVLLLLEADGMNVTDGFSLFHKDVMNILWGVGSLLDQAIETAG